MTKVLNLIANKRFLILLFSIVTVGITIQRYFLPVNSDGWSGYNNFIIFKQSFYHLINGQDIYQLFLHEHQDLFKYSPTFALLMGVISPLPNFIGLLIWNGLNIGVFFYAFWKIPFSNKNYRYFAFLFILIELITSTQNSQSNALIAGLIILAYLALEKNKVAIAALLVVSTVFIKIFGIVALVMFLFYPNKIKSGLYVFLWTILLAVLPLIVVPYEQLIFLYKSWLNLLQNDHSTLMKFSVMGILQSWFGVSANYKSIVLFIGMIMFCIPLIRFKTYAIPRYKLLFLASVLIWVIIFNHMAESATFIIAVVGVAIWFFTKTSPSKLDYVLLISTFILTSLSPTDIFPASVRNNFFIPYTIKVLPCILVWIKINYELLTLKLPPITSE